MTNTAKKFAPLPASRSAWEIELVEHIGLECLLKLESDFGGAYLYIHSKTPSQALINSVGFHAAQRLSDWYGSSDIYVPLVALRKDRNAQILLGRKTGKNIKDLADKFRLTTKRIREILKERNDAKYNGK